MNAPPAGAPRLLIRGARLLDPENGLDAVGDLLIEGERIAAVGGNLAGCAAGAEIVTAAGLCLAPGLVDMRVQLREPGAEHMESIESGGRAAAAGGVTTMVALPNTEPTIDDVSVVEFLARRAREARLAKIHTYAAATKGLLGRHLTEMGLLAANGALGFTDGVKAIGDALVMRRVLAYARSFDLLGAATSGRAEPRRGGRGQRGRDRHPAGAAGDPGRGRDHHDRARPAARRADRRALSRRPPLDRRRGRGDPSRQGAGAAGHLRHRTPLFHPERDRDRRLPHLCQIVAAAAQRSRPPRH